MKKSTLLKGKKLTNKLDQVVREIMHIVYGENPDCFVCDRKDAWYNPKTCHRGMQVGHYISRRFPVVRWFLPNLFPQCAGCNISHNTNPAPFTMAIIKKIGYERIELLNNMAKHSVGEKFTDADKRELLEKLLRLKEELLATKAQQLTDSSLYARLDTWNNKSTI